MNPNQMSRFLLSLVKYWSIQSLVIVSRLDDNGLNLEDLSKGLGQISACHTIVPSVDKVLLDDGSGSVVLIMNDSLLSPALESLIVELYQTTWILPCSAILKIHSILRLDSSVFCFEQASDEGQVNLDEVYSLKQETPGYIQRYASWSSRQGLHVTELDKWERRSNFMGRQIDNVMNHFPPYQFNVKDDNGYLTDINGFFPATLKLLSMHLNITLSTYEPEDQNWGTSFDNGTVTGLIGEIANQKADISAALLTSTSTRSLFMDFSLALAGERVTIVRKNPESKSLNWFAFLRVLRPDTWAVTASFILTTAALLYLTFTLCHRIEGYSLGKTLAMALLMIIQKDNPIEVTQMSARILLFSTSITAFLIYGFYTGLLTSIMTFKDTATPIRTLQDVYDNNLNLITIRDGATFELISKAKETNIIHKLYNERVKNKPENEFSEAEGAYSALMEDGPSTVFFGSEYAIFKTEESRRTMQILDLVDTSYEHMCFGLQKNSELTSMVNYHLLKLHHSGMIQRLRSEWFTWEREGMFLEDPEPSVEVGFENVLFPFFVLFGGCGLAGAMAAYETTKRVVTSS